MEDLQVKFNNILQFQDDKITLEATVPTGLESIAVRELIENNISVAEHICFVSGRVYFHIKPDIFNQVTKLRSFDNINLFVDYISGLKFNNDKEHDLASIVSLIGKIDFEAAIKSWASISNFKGIILPTKEQHDNARIKQDKIYHCKCNNQEFDRVEEEYNHNVLKYRVTCDRIGGKHSFSSNEAAYKFGGELNNAMQWIVALSDWDLNVLLRIQQDNAMVCFKVTPQSLHRRCLIDFGPTSLRPTISYGMLALAKLKPGEHIVDPLCGSGSIPIECMYAFPNVIISCGDIHFRAVERTLRNMQGQETTIPKPDIFKWDSTSLPFKSHTLDAIVTDLPFGKRSGTKKNNAVLYKTLVNEFARVIKLETGRLVLLTQDSPHLFKALHYREPKSCWHITQIICVNVGALKCNIIVARRKNIDKDISEEQASSN